MSRSPPVSEFPADRCRVSFVLELRVQHNEHGQQHPNTAGGKKPFAWSVNRKGNDAFRFALTDKWKKQNVYN